MVFRVPRSIDEALLDYYRIRQKDFFNRTCIRRALAYRRDDWARLGIKKSVRLIGNFPGLWRRTIQQTPSGACIFGSTLFVCDGPADYYVILNTSCGYKGDPDIHPDLKLVPKEKIIGLHMEPGEYVEKLGYDNESEHSRIGRFFTSSQKLYQKGGIYRPAPPYVHWHLGKSYDQVARATSEERTIDLGVIVSDLSDLQGQKKRLKFLKDLEDAEMNFVVWGRGNGLKTYKNFQGFVLNKWSAIRRCRYMLVLENSCAPFYWSEKFTDCVLGGAMPIYFGCPNLEDFFPTKSFFPIDISKKKVIDEVRTRVSLPISLAEQGALEDARRLILTRENLYAFLDQQVNLCDAP